MTQSNSEARPSSFKELVKAWKVSGKKAQVLETRLQQAVDVARRYRRDLLRLAEQNRSRKLRADELQEKLLQLLEKQNSEPAPSPPLPDIADTDETVPADTVRQLLIRLREAHDLVAEFETLLEFREKQVHELLTHQSQSPIANDWRVHTLQRELTEARHRIRLLTQELAQQQVNAEASSRVAELEQQLGQVIAQGDQALQNQLQQRDTQIAHLQEQVNVRLEELKKSVATLHTARDRIKSLEQELTAAQAAAKTLDTHTLEDHTELLHEVTHLQDELARMQDENEELSLLKNQAEVQLPILQQQISELTNENAQLKARPLITEDKERMAKLETAVTDMRQKLQLAGTKYQEVRATLIEKHQQMLTLQSRNQELERNSETLHSSGKTLEIALTESRKQNTTLQAQLESLRKTSTVTTGSVLSGDATTALASMEAKLKDARRTAVRAQAEAGLKRKEMAKLQEEILRLKNKLITLGSAP